MAWKIEHTYDPVLKVVSARFEDVRIVTVADVERWKNETEAQHEAIGVRADLLVDLNGLEVSATMKEKWTAARRSIADKYLNRVYRYNGGSWTRTRIYTGAVLGGAGGEVYPTRDAALAALLADRKARGQ